METAITYLAKAIVPLGVVLFFVGMSVLANQRFRPLGREAVRGGLADFLGLLLVCILPIALMNQRTGVGALFLAFCLITFLFPSFCSRDEYSGETTNDRSHRLLSIDAYRGFVMLAMASDELRLAQVFRNNPPNLLTNLPGIGWLESQTGQTADALWNSLWQTIVYQFSHVGWTGCAFWDLIQPSFMFLVGVAMPFSYSRRHAEGQAPGGRFLHALLRSIILVALGVFLSSNGQSQTNVEFPNVLCQIGLGYIFVYALLGAPTWAQWLALAVILGGSWAMFFTYTPPENLPDGIPADWKVFGDGLAVHWNRHMNFAGAFDRWFLNLFPRAKTFTANGGGYQTLNFVPAMGTMLLGVLAGQYLRSSEPTSKVRNRLILASLLCFAIAMTLDHTIWPTGMDNLIRTGLAKVGAGPNIVDHPFWTASWTVCPVVKKIWTPTWTIFSSGWTFLFLAFFYGRVELRGDRTWVFPLIVVGSNSILIYLLANTMDPWVGQTLRTHFGQDIFAGVYGPLVQSLCILFVYWLLLFWLYRSKVFLKI